jgi:hypothetical protein
LTHAGPANAIPQAAAVIGHSLLEDNEMLLSETQALADLVASMHAGNEQLLAQAQLCANPQRVLLQSRIEQLAAMLRGTGMQESCSDQRVIAFVEASSRQVGSQ